MFDRDHGIIISCDVDTESRLKQIVDATSSVDGIVGYKIGFTLGLILGLGNVIAMVKDTTDLPVIYDHQKAGNDIPEMGDKFAGVMKLLGVDSAILFPFAGGETEKQWILSLQKSGVVPMVGGEMTHPDFFEFLKEDASERMYLLADRMNVEFFIVPGTKPERMKEISERFPDKKFCFPGIGTQGGDLEVAFGSIRTPSYAIIGSSIYNASDMRESARMYAAIAKRF